MQKVESKELKSLFKEKASGTSCISSLRVLGNEDNPGKGIISIGNYMALDHSRGAAVYIDALKPHAVLICGKRG